MMMPNSDKIQISLLQLLILSALLIFSSTSSAESTPNSDSLKALNDNEIIFQSGELIISLPYSGKTTLLEQIRAERQQLTKENSKLQHVIEKKSFSGSDLFILAVLPGGAIYSAIKHHQLKQAEQELEAGISRYSDLTQAQLELELEFFNLNNQVATHL